MTATWPHPARWSSAALADALSLPGPSEAQQRVIEAPPGPALVIAGAGSGKTETMASRVVWLSANGYVAPEQILGLTFTRRAAGELRDRLATRLETLRSVVRRDQADGWASMLEVPEVSTYNAFADGIVREHGPRVGLDGDAPLLTDASAWLLARRVIEGSDHPGLVDLETSLSSTVDAVLRLHRAMLDHGADPGAVAHFGSARAAELADVLERRSSNSREDDVAKAAARMRALPTFVALAAEYASAKTRRGVRDYADQVDAAHRILTDVPDVAVRVRDQFRVVLLDEYQDTSVRQTDLFAALFAHETVMAVGDPHQSIYGWRGASADNLAAFADAFAPGGEVQRYELVTSWRNDRAILDVANTVVAPLRAQSAVEVPQLQPRPGAGSGRVTTAVYETVSAEADAVADWFSQSPELSGAILFRAKRHMPVFAEALARRGIAHRVVGLGGLLSTPEVVDVVSVLRVLARSEDGSALIRLLTGPRFAVGVADVAGLRQFADTLADRDGLLRLTDESVRALRRRIARADDSVSIVGALAVAARLPDDHGLIAHITPAGRGRLREAAAMLDRLREVSAGDVRDLLWATQRELRLDIELAAGEHRGPQALQNLRAFGDHVLNVPGVGERDDDARAIDRIVEWLQRAEQHDDLAPPVDAVQAGVVHLLTVHGAKGLEWDRVAVPRLSAGEFPAAPRTTLGWLGVGELPHPFRGDRRALPALDIPDAADDPSGAETKRAIEAFKRDMREHLMVEEQRLAYVAVTRARHDVLLTSAFWSGGLTPRAPGPVLTAIDPSLPMAPLGENPSADGGERLSWPMDPLGSRAGCVRAAGDAVRAAMSDPPPPNPRVAKLLLEQDLGARGAAETVLPARLSASGLGDILDGSATAPAHRGRPMPEEPLRRSRLGTRFHAWVEQRFGQVLGTFAADQPLWSDDVLVRTGGAPSAVDGTHAGHLADENAELQRLIDAFEQTPWARRAPIAVEEEIDLLIPGLGDDAGRVVVCKLDAVFAGENGRIEIVDWKTGSSPRSHADRETRFVQVGLYRMAYSARHGIPVDQIDVSLVYLGDGVTVREPHVLTADEVVRRWHAAGYEACPSSRSARMTSRMSSAAVSSQAASPERPGGATGDVTGT